MNHSLTYTALLAASVAVLAGCASRKAVQQGVGITPAPVAVFPDSANRLKLDVKFHVPEHYFSRRNRLIITPQFIAGKGTVDFAAAVVDAPAYTKKQMRKQVLEGLTDPLAAGAIRQQRAGQAVELAYSDSVLLPFEATDGRIIAIVSKNGCGECTGVDTVDIGTVSNPVTLIEPEKGLELSWQEPEFVIRPKIMEGRGTANLQFKINKYDIDLALGHNREEMEKMTNTLRPILDDTLATLKGLAITGLASADGSLALNTRLARNRAASARAWLVDHLKGTRTVLSARMITADSRPEGWMPVVAAMAADGNADSVKVKAILDKYADSNDDVQESYIRRLDCWEDIREKYLQKDRKVEYVYNYTIRSFTTDAELLAMYDKRPDAFNEEELLRVATLAEGDDRKMEVYQTLTRYFPQSQVAANNTAVLYLRKNQPEEAQKVLERMKDFSPEMLNTLAATYVYHDDYERAVELLQDVKLPEARYNLGLLKAKQRKLQEAYELLRPFGDLNSAIAALSVRKDQEAQDMLDKLDDRSPRAEYARAIACARLGDTAAAREHLENACTEPALAARAATDPEFATLDGATTGIPSNANHTRP